MALTAGLNKVGSQQKELVLLGAGCFGFLVIVIDRHVVHTFPFPRNHLRRNEDYMLSHATIIVDLV